eukprot:m.132099 g.132099  ORF g.132099 m.132099 type:complete len:386 (-) comp13085_c0_seq6:6865-8022(-)
MKPTALTSDTTPPPPPPSSSSSSSPPLQPRDSSFACRKCNRKFTLKSSLRRHQRQCGMSFHCSCFHAPFKSFEALRIHAKRLEHTIPSATRDLVTRTTMKQSKHRGVSTNTKALQGQRKKREKKDERMSASHSTCTNPTQRLHQLPIQPTTKPSSIAIYTPLSAQAAIPSLTSSHNDKMIVDKGSQIAFSSSTLHSVVSNECQTCISFPCTSQQTPMPTPAVTSTPTSTSKTCYVQTSEPSFPHMCTSSMQTCFENNTDCYNDLLFHDFSASYHVPTKSTNCQTDFFFPLLFDEFDSAIMNGHDNPSSSSTNNSHSNTSNKRGDFEGDFEMTTPTTTPMASSSASQTTSLIRMPLVSTETQTFEEDMFSIPLCDAATDCDDLFSL